MSTATSTSFDIGDQPTLVFTFTNEAGVLESPTAITFSQIAPDGTQINENQTNATQESTGIWSWTIPAPFDAPGTWKYRAAATAGLIVAEELSLKVRKSAFT